ncbi:hypothetical protein ACHHYP_01352 [Achlya hypogyna]|uniref:GAF domain-containing protein n=1 Tax=Achlya hypogyna TaxID=1202772 RepID=A0A1V9ZTH3_ACHHY|nr:hypothetical protein ACHHYP_01352 [Achlya hypogyna]
MGDLFIVRSEYGAKDRQRGARRKDEWNTSAPVADEREDSARPYALTNLNRVGSSPQLPLQSAPHCHAFSSSKKRLLPASPPSKLQPLDRPKAIMSAPPDASRAELDRQVTSLRATVAALEKELSDTSRALQRERRQCEQAVSENGSLKEQVTALTQLLHDEREITTQQKKAFAKLSQKYISVNETFHRLAAAAPEKAVHSAHETQSLKGVLATLARENQDHERKIKVLERQHAEDKRNLANAEKRMKLLKAELEAIEHMQMTQMTPTPDTHDAKKVANTSDELVVTNPEDARAMAAMVEQYIDPNLMRILHKVDSQFSISNAIGLSATLKRWLHSCQSINVSLDIGVVLEELLKKVCAVLQCEHAALFQLHGRKLLCRCTNFGVTNVEIPADKGIVSFVLTSKAPCSIQSAYDDPRFYSPQDNATGITTRDIVCVPVLDARHEVLAVVRACNTTHYKGFTPNDQIVLSLFAVQAGILLEQFQMADRLEASSTKLLRLHEMPRPLVSESIPNLEAMSLIRFVLATENKFRDILGATKVKMFVIDDGDMMWCVGTTLDPSCNTQHFRQYYKLSSGLCGLAAAHPRGLTVPAAFAHPRYNGAVDLNNLAHGLYVVPITSYWGKPLGVLQVARTATLAQGPKREVALQQNAEDDLRLHLLSIFAQTISGILHHVIAYELAEACPPEVRAARRGALEEVMAQDLAGSAPLDARKASAGLTREEAQHMRKFVEKSGLAFGALHPKGSTKLQPNSEATAAAPVEAPTCEGGLPLSGKDGALASEAVVAEPLNGPRPRTVAAKATRRSSVAAPALVRPVVAEDRRQSLSHPTGESAKTAMAKEFPTDVAGVVGGPPTPPKSEASAESGVFAEFLPLSDTPAGIEALQKTEESPLAPSDRKEPIDELTPMD